MNAMGNHWPGSKEVAGATGWIKRYSVRNQLLVRALRRDIDRGEAESIALAIELEALRHIAGFYLEESFYQYVLDLAGEINI